MISVVVPIFNEEENIPHLYERLAEELAQLSEEFEVIFVDDGSVDGSFSELEKVAQKDDRFGVLSLRRNYGQTAAMMAGFDCARGDVIIPMDGDLQNDPSDIQRLLDKLSEGYDVVSGWRKNRKDSFRRNLPSWLANRLVSTISGIHLHDYGCTLKAYRAEVIRDVRLYGEMHRFIPIYASWQGARVTEIPVKHHPRVHGKSRYGFDRILKVVLDLIVIKFLAKYATKPIYIFGTFGIFCIGFSGIIGIYTLYLKIFEEVSFILTPLPLLVAIGVITGILSILMGLLAELVMRTYFESQGKPVYAIKATTNIKEQSAAGE